VIRSLKSVPIPPVRPNAVFLNIPYDDRFRRQYLAYIVGLSQLGLQPRATLGIPGGERRLDRILALIQSATAVQVRRLDTHVNSYVVAVLQAISQSKQLH
jgi:hypothetical protein